MEGVALSEVVCSLKGEAGGKGGGGGGGGPGEGRWGGGGGGWWVATSEQVCKRGRRGLRLDSLGEYPE